MITRSVLSSLKCTRNLATGLRPDPLGELQDVLHYRMFYAIVSKLLYASPSWSGYINAEQFYVIRKLFAKRHRLMHGKGKDAVVGQLRMEHRLVSLSQAIEPVGGYTTESACDAWPVRRQTYGYLPNQWPVRYQFLYCLVNRGTLCVNNLPRVVT